MFDDDIKVWSDYTRHIQACKSLDHDYQWADYVIT